MKGSKSLQAKEMARPTGVEPVTPASGEQSRQSALIGFSLFFNALCGFQPYSICIFLLFLARLVLIIDT
ncbi:MAG: hypothetical protein ACQESI_01810 [Pseudomonadota bacterium]